MPQVARRGVGGQGARQARRNREDARRGGPPARQALPREPPQETRWAHAVRAQRDALVGTVSRVDHDPGLAEKGRRVAGEPDDGAQQPKCPFQGGLSDM